MRTEHHVLGPENKQVVMELKWFCYLYSIVDREDDVKKQSDRERLAAAWFN